MVPVSKRAGHTTKGERTRARLLEAGRRELEKRGYLDTKIADIAAEAGLAVGSFYTYFETKEDLFIELVRQFYAEMQPVSMGESGEDPVAQIEITYRRYVDFYAKNRRMIALVESVLTFFPEIRRMRLANRRNFVRINVRAIERLQDEGLDLGDLDPFVTASALLSMVSNLTYSWLVLGEDFDTDVAVRHVTTLWTQALRLDHWQKKVEGATGRLRAPAS